MFKDVWNLTIHNYFWLLGNCLCWLSLEPPRWYLGLRYRISIVWFSWQITSRLGFEKNLPHINVVNEGKVAMLVAKLPSSGVQVLQALHWALICDFQVYAFDLNWGSHGGWRTRPIHMATFLPFFSSSYQVPLILSFETEVKLLVSALPETPGFYIKQNAPPHTRAPGRQEES